MYNDTIISVILCTTHLCSNKTGEVMSNLNSTHWGNFISKYSVLTIEVSDFDQTSVNGKN